MIEQTMTAGNVTLVIIKTITTVLNYLLMPLLTALGMDFIVNQAIKKSDKDVWTEIKIIAKLGYSNGRY